MKYFQKFSPECPFNAIPSDSSSKNVFVFFVLMFENCLGKLHCDEILEASFITASKLVLNSFLQKFMRRS